MESLGGLGPASSAGDRELAVDNGQAAEPANDSGEGKAETVGSEAGTADAFGESEVEAAGESAAKSPNASEATRRPRRQRGAKFWAVVGAIVVAAVGGTLASWGAGWLNFVAPPPASSAAPIVNPGHLPGRQDVSTTAPGRRFYAIPNFYFFQSCGRPCWLPLYELPTEQSAFVTDGWPCEYYEPNSSNGPFCLQPPSRRTQSEMADPAVRNSGDRLLVVCQVTQISKGQPAQAIRNEVGQSSNIWDMVAVPQSYISADSAAIGRLRQVPGMPGYYEAYGPDMWIGNTGWHSIPCK
jgi:hypothetical protein